MECNATVNFYFSCLCVESVWWCILGFEFVVLFTSLTFMEMGGKNKTYCIKINNQLHPQKVPWNRISAYLAQHQQQQT